MVSALIQPGIGSYDSALFIPTPYRDSINKFGNNPAAAADEDVWSGSIAYPWPTAVGTITVSSASADDAAAGTGARTVRLQGVDGDGLLVTQDITMNGTSDVTAGTDLYRCFRANVLTSGSNERNVGDISIDHDGTTIAVIPADVGQTLMAVYTVPADYRLGIIFDGEISLVGNPNVTVNYVIDTRPFGGSWLTKTLGSVTASTPKSISVPGGIQCDPRTDIRVRITDITSGTPNVTATFDMLLLK